MYGRSPERVHAAILVPTKRLVLRRRTKCCWRVRLHTVPINEDIAMNTNRIARIASLLGEPARTAMLVELMGGQALTASEMARAAGVGASTASAHLAQLVDAQLLRVTPSVHAFGLQACCEQNHLSKGCLSNVALAAGKQAR